MQHLMWTTSYAILAEYWSMFYNYQIKKKFTMSIIVNIEKNYLKSVALKQNTIILAFQCK